MARRIYDVELWKVHLWFATACTVMLSQCVLSLSEEGQLLLTWKRDVLQDPDNNLSNWNASDATPCFWNGVNCTESSVSALDFSPFWQLGGNINELPFAKLANLTALNVGNTSLLGTFPLDILNCSKLVSLNLSWSYISGEVPANILNLQRLQVLDLTYGEFEGTMVSRIGVLQELRVLRLGLNHFEGQIPESILSLTKLQELTLAQNNWNSTPPLGFFTIPNLTVLWLGSNLDLVEMVPWPNFSLWENMEDLRLNGLKFPQALFPTGIFQMTKLKTLHLARCNITGPIPSLENMTHLEFLNLGNNTLTGQIPDMFGGMPQFKVLWLYQNQLTGPLPSSLSQCRKLRVIDAFQSGLGGDLSLLGNLSGSMRSINLGTNNFNGEIPPGLGNLTLLTYLDLHLNNLSGEIPPSLGNLSLLTYIDLDQNNLSGKIPPEVANCEGLVQLRLSDNQLNGEIPYNLGKKSFLERVDLTNNRLEGPIPPYLCWGDNMTLQFLLLGGNRLTGKIPETYGNCTSLQIVRFDGNLLEGSVPVGLWGGPNLNRMMVNGNNLSGIIDVNIGKAKNLSILYLQDNSFSGPIPPEIGQTSLSKFLANSNKFNGTLTPFLGNLSGLNQLILSSNAFIDTIPSTLGNCTELVQLDLSKNYLDGIIPNELVYLDRLSILNLSQNNLIGTIPQGLFSMVTLQTLNVAFNNLSGVIPNHGNGLIFVTVNFTGNPYLCLEGLCGTNTSAINSASNRDKKQAWIVVVGVFAAVVLVLFVALVLIFTRYKNAMHEQQTSKDKSWTLTSFHNKIYHEDEVTALDEDNLIGAGASGKVYKVTLGDGEIVAVKKLWDVKKDEGSHKHGFSTELRTLANIRHRHIVKLLCSCTKRDNNLLVYEYMPKGSLGDLLHGPKAELLPWKIRYKIVVGVAKALQYLHHDCSPQILHRDIKSNNILVNLEYEAYLADFGIAKMIEPTTSHDLSSIAGSLGYIPPEYLFDTRMTEKIDIYSFGVVMLELVTGKQANEPLDCVEGTNLVQWVHNRIMTPKGLCEILDSNCGTSSHKDMLVLLKIAILCTSYMPTSRPSMREVVKLLEDIATKSLEGMKTEVSKDGVIVEGLHHLNVHV